MNPIVNYDDDHHSEDESVQQNDHQNMNMNQNAPHQEAPNGGTAGVPQIDHVMMMQLLQQVLIMNQNALAHIRQLEPRITLERLKKNGAEEFLGENIADPLIAFRWIERERRVFKNLKVPASEWADFAVMLLQGNAYEWWKRTTRNANHPAKVTWAYFEQVFREEYIPESFVEEKREEFLHLEMGTMSLPEYRQLFDHLAEFGQDLVNTTKRRCDKFVKGMRPNCHGILNHIHDVYFIPKLAYNLLSVGQLMSTGYMVFFEDNSCVIKEKKSGQIIAKVCMTRNKMFPLRISSVDKYALVSGTQEASKLSHQ
ncbi:unnamed protein product [Cuscuta campestris]|uniref:Retrotransposon gag domain-containing protein n=1 Tax=Cuscuta campestris TaxID=132261 RepID=A0A484MBG6_9ASTE|nr:unnamed protein product [Cuscuta campestris]